MVAADELLLEFNRRTNRTARYSVGHLGLLCYKGREETHTKSTVNLCTRTEKYTRIYVQRRMHIDLHTDTSHAHSHPDLLLKFSCAVGAVKTCDDVRERRRWRLLPGSFLMVRVDIYPGRLWAVAAAPTEMIQPAIQNIGIYSDRWSSYGERSGDVRPPCAHAAPLFGDTMHLTRPLSEPQALCWQVS